MEWRLLSYYDNFFPALGALAVAAYLEENGFSVAAIDCCLNRWGWKTTEKMVKRINADVVGISGPIVWTQENIRLGQMVKQYHPNAILIYGGPHITLYPQSVIFEGSPFDFGIYGEGEITTLELMRELRKPEHARDFTQIKGLVFLRNGRLHQTAPRPLIEDLDTLPMPAYHLLPVERYGSKHNTITGKGVTIYHSKGCTNACTFCACWCSGGDIREIRPGGGLQKVFPRYRSKSAKKTCEEMKYLEDTYKRDYFAFTDDTWNVNPRWEGEFIQEYKAHGITGGWFGFMRIDYITRDIPSGLFKRLHDETNMVHIAVGIERADQASLDEIKKNITVQQSKYVFDYVRHYCKNTFLQAQILTGLWDDRPEDIMMQAKFARYLGVDYPAMLPMTPFPGTELYDWYDSRGLMKQDFSWDEFEFDTALVPTKHMTREEVAKQTRLANIYFALNPLYWIRGITSRALYKRRIYLMVIRNTIKAAVRSLLKFENPFEVASHRAKHMNVFNMVAAEWNEN
jgi:anaerobic magnesium-protoporphyrin IX monomethyl ester cyclase